MGVQEAKPNQMDDLKNALQDYKSIEIGRDGVFSSSINLKYPSHHFPVFVELNLK